MFGLLDKYDDIITSVRVVQLDQEVQNTRLKLEVAFVDGSKLHVRDYCFGADGRKYVFHWMDEHNQLRIRWDNSPHWPDISTHPHHRHVQEPQNVEASTEVSLEEILGVIHTYLVTS